jgi:hypothetical protein
MKRKEISDRCKATGYTVNSGINWAFVEGIPTEQAAKECMLWFNGVARHGNLQQDTNGTYSFRYHLFD